MIAISAIDKNWGIGYKNQLLFHIKDDMRRFKNLTQNHTVIMGRKTLESFPSGEPLVDRTNIVLSNTHESGIFNNVNYMSVDDRDNLNTIIPDSHQAFLIGGESIYKKFINQCEYAYLTKIGKISKNVDTYFPNLDKMDNWKIVYIDGTYYDKENKCNYDFVVYQNLMLV